MSPILVRPVREQLEHDRVIRLLQAKYKRKYDVAINPGQLQVAPVGTAGAAWYPDLVLHTTERGRRLAGVVEVETAESVNNLEAMSQWRAFARQRADFHLYVPASAIDATRRLCSENGIEVTEIWAYHSVGDQLRFVLVQRAPGAPVEKPAPAPKPAKAAAKAAPPPKASTPAKTVAAKAAPAKPVASKAASSGKVSSGKASTERASSSPNGRPANGKSANGTPANGKSAAKASSPKVVKPAAAPAARPAAKPAAAAKAPAKAAAGVTKAKAPTAKKASPAKSPRR